MFIKATERYIENHKIENATSLSNSNAKFLFELCEKNDA